MSTNGQKASLLAAGLIEVQLRTLPVVIAAVTRAFEKHDVATAVLQKPLRLIKTASGGNIVADAAEEEHALLMSPAEAECVRVMVSNSLLAVGAFMQTHNMLAMRTPEFQFLGHVVKSILNDNTFDLLPGYMPVASFDGLKIDSSLHGMPLFADERGAGFMEFGDAVALLEWLARYLRGERNYVSGGDAG